MKQTKEALSALITDAKQKVSGETGASLQKSNPIEFKKAKKTWKRAASNLRRLNALDVKLAKMQEERAKKEEAAKAKELAKEAGAAAKAAETPAES